MTEQPQTTAGAANNETELLPPNPADVDTAWSLCEDEPPSRRREALRAVLAGFGCAVLGALVAGLVIHLTTTSAPAPARVEVMGPVSTVTAPPPPSPDERFIAAISKAGLTNNGVEAVRQRFMEFAHFACFALLPPKPQQFESVAAQLVTRENADVALNDPGSPHWEYEDGAKLVRAAVTAYCPDAGGAT